MNKQPKIEFGKTIKHIMDVLTPSVEAVAQTLKGAPEMAQKIYNGVTNGSNMTRAAIIQALYDEQKKKETVELIKETVKETIMYSIMDNLKVEKRSHYLYVLYDGHEINVINLDDY